MALNATEMQDAAVQLDNAEATGESLEQAPAQAQQAPAQEKTAPTFDAQQEFQRMREEFNKVNSEVGQLRKIRSEFEKMQKEKATQTNTAPKSWQDLDEATRKATEEMVMHIVEQRMADKFGKYDRVAEGYEVQERNSRIVGLASEILGTEYEKYNKPLGDTYSAVKKFADEGDERAQKFLEEIHSTESGVYRLIEIVKSQVSQTMQAQSEKAKLEQEAKAKRVSTGVGGGRTSTPASGKDGLPTDKTERLAAMRAQLDDYYSDQQR